MGRGLRRHQRLGHRRQIDHDHGHQDHEHAQALLDTLEKEVAPTFYDRDEHGVPHRWVQMMRSLATLAWRFSASRMMRDYASTIYTTG